ncbi:MAG: DUF4249 domain-containing protein [Bacteroidia bacterium]|nr:DUF4249 domain-containing protein [Bacteroidia bacterium]
MYRPTLFSRPVLFPWLAALALSWSLSSCVPEPVLIEIPQAESRLVVASQLLPGNFLLVNVSRSIGALEYSQQQTDTLSDDILSRLLLDSALVVLTWPGGSDTLIELGAGTWISLATQLEVGVTYDLTVVDSLTGQTVRASASPLPIVPWDSVAYRYVYDTIQFGGSFSVDTSVALHIQFTDPAADNYYLINNYRVRIPDSSALGQVVGTDNQQVTFLSDQLFKSPVYRDTLIYPGFGPGDTLAVTLSNISQLYYDFLTVRQRSGTNILSILLKEPVSYPSNVEGGYGIFALQLPDVRVLILR